MGAFIMRLLDVDAVEARRVQKQYFHDHGTTMAGLTRHHDVTPEEFLADAHATTPARIAPDAPLRAVPAGTPGRSQTLTKRARAYCAWVPDARGAGDLLHGTSH